MGAQGMLLLFLTKVVYATYTMISSFPHSHLLFSFFFSLFLLLFLPWMRLWWLELQQPSCSQEEWPRKSQTFQLLSFKTAKQIPAAAHLQTFCFVRQRNLHCFKLLSITFFCELCVAGYILITVPLNNTLHSPVNYHGSSPLIPSLLKTLFQGRCKWLNPHPHLKYILFISRYLLDTSIGQTFTFDFSLLIHCTLQY